VLRFGYSTLNWGDSYDVDEMLGQIHRAGWKAVEMFAQPLNWLGPHTRLQAQLDRVGIKAATFFGSVDLPTGDQQLAMHQRRIDYAALVGAECYGLVGGTRLRWRPPTSDEYASLARFCDELAKYGAERGVTVAYHPHVGCTIETEEEIDRLLDHSRHMQLCLDASHIALVDEDPVAHLRKYRERTGYIHLKDWARGKFVEMGQGTIGIDFPAILKELEAQKFGGWVIIEQSRSDVSPEQSARINADYLTSRGYAL
jgi:inosose dehydratase